MIQREVETDVLIVGGGCGGSAAALALVAAGVPCILTEPTSMLGGQLSSQGVPPDENPWVDGNGPGAPTEFFAANRSYLELRSLIRTELVDGLTPSARSQSLLNPGGGWVSRLCFEPRLADVGLRRMLGALPEQTCLTIECGWRPIGAEVVGDHVHAVEFETGSGTVVVRARIVLDATEDGEVLALAGVEHAIGGESADVYGELHAPADGHGSIDVLDQQACTWCFAVEHDPCGEHVIDRPAMYDAWRSHVPEMQPAWTGPLFSWTVPSHNEAGRLTLPLVPPPDVPSDGLELWRYRRIVDGAAHVDGRPDVSLMNVVQMDFWRAPLLGVSSEARERALRDAREQSKCFLYWMQTEAPRHDSASRKGYPGLRLSGASLGSDDGFALAPYIREPRRMSAMTMLTEAHVGAQQRREQGETTAEGTEFVRGGQFADSIAIGHYPIDLHPSCSGRNSVYVDACPYQIPLRSIVPKRVRNVVASGKCLGVSHIANGCTRLHPVEWAVGEAAGTLAALCVQESNEPHAVVEHRSRVRALQELLAERGVPLRWPWDDGEQEWQSR
ncbi:MAG: FAD-dependent oxidoreductase [Planctomycetota bacterium]